MKNPTYREFVAEMFQYVFDGLITGGTKEMKNRFDLSINSVAQIMTSGGFAKEGE